jgi:hypothetical protein
MTIRPSLLFGAALLPVAAPAASQQAAQSAATAQPAASTDQTSDDDPDEVIVVTGQRPRGSVVGDIPPQNVLDSRDVRATGATSINELLQALAPQIGSVQGRGGGQPVLLLNGLRVSSFRELRDIPTEAIERVEILPEEVALKYGYRADQKVLNIVLRPRFRSTVAQLGATSATDGGYTAATGELTRLMIRNNGRTQFNLHATGNSMLTEDEREVDLGTSTPPEALAARSLIGSKRDLRGSAILNRQVFGDVSATVNAELEHSEGRSLIGLGDILLLPLARNTNAESAHLGAVLNGTKSNWHWTLTGNADLDHSFTRTQRDRPDFPTDTARETTRSGDLKFTANGNLIKLPAGMSSTTLTLAGTTNQLDSRGEVGGQPRSSSLGRTTGEAAINLDLPISRRNRDFSALGNLTLNGNAEVDRLSDFGTLTTIGAGANWSPVDRLNFITSWTREEGPPTINQLGDPLLETPNVRIFDFSTGQTMLVDVITGGNPNLQPDKRKVFKLGANWQPFPNTDFRLRADYVHQSIERPMSNLTVTPAIEAAFPDRFVRDSSGQLLSVDLRPVNFDSSRRDSLRLGFDFSKPLKSRRPSQSVIDQIRAQWGGGRTRGGGAGGGETRPPGPPPEDAGAFRGAPGGGGGGDRWFGGGGGGFFGGNRGRLQFSLTDTITFVDRVTIAPGLSLDYLHGDAVGQTGGTPRHSIEAQGGWSNNGIGARIGANWRSGTTVKILTGDDLRFSPLATFDLRFFANPGDVPDVAIKHPWLRGTQVRFDATNIFNSRPQVHDAAGGVPINYQPDLLDPLGRTFMISFRKSFLPPPRAYIRERQQNEAPPPPAKPAT